MKRNLTDILTGLKRARMMMEMKRFLTLCVAIALLCQPCLAENALRQMRVANCEEWVSLREEADVHSERVAKVPYGAVVDVFGSEGMFMLCCYNGAYGYILSDYLEELGYEEYGMRFTIEEGMRYMRMVNEAAGREILSFPRIEDCVDGGDEVVGDVVGVVDGTMEIAEAHYFLVRADFQDRTNPRIRELYVDAAQYFVTLDRAVAEEMFDELMTEFEKEYQRNRGTTYLIVDRYDRVGRYVGVFDDDDGNVRFMAFMGELQ